ncbi:MAG: selenocysteine-specific translation elongation factor [Gemmataceae bacterium]
MPRELILGTAGHIDHGKTTLIKALTGVDCDRLPEEKARGITIDLGFAELDLDEFRLGVIDVPGHERFIKNMLAGATGIDLALLVIAADDSVMPQTREHLEILKLLGIRRGVISVTKCDLVDRESLEVAVLEVRELVAGSFLADAPLICTSVTSGEGLDQLRTALFEQCLQFAKDESESHSDPSFIHHPSSFPFRLSIDRVFVQQGHGTVITGTVASGHVRVGDEVEWLPSQERVRVRGLQHHGRPVDNVHRGMRAAINLAGVDHTEVQRGQELAAPGYLVPSRTLSVYLTATRENARPLKHRLPVRVHIGTAEVMGVLSLLDTNAVAPGDSAKGQMFLEEPVMAVWNQPFVLRESSAASTLGGGRVLQPGARKIRKHDMLNVGGLADLNLTPPLNRIAAVGLAHGSTGFTEADLVREAGIAPESAAALVGEMVKSGQMIEVHANDQRRLVHEKALREIEDRVLTTMAKLHAAEPLVSGHDRAKALALLDYIGDESLVSLVVDRMIEAKKLMAEGRRIARADFQPKLSANQRKLKDKIVAAHAAAGFEPPEPKSFAPQASGQAANLLDLYDVAVAEGMLVKVNDDIYLHTDAEARMRHRVQSALADSGQGLKVAAIRDLLGTTRKYAVPLCEYLDRVGVTRRVGDFRVPAQESAVAGE